MQRRGGGFLSRNHPPKNHENNGIMNILDKKGLQQWYVMRAYKSEQKAEKALETYGVLRYYIPKKIASRTYHGVKTHKLVPVIPSIIFVHATKDEIVQFKKLYNFIQFVMQSNVVSGKPSYLTVPERQMENFSKVVSANEKSTVFHSPEEIDPKKGKPANICGGSLDAVEGLFMAVKGKRNRRLVVILDGICAVSVEIHPDQLSLKS